MSSAKERDAIGGGCIVWFVGLIVLGLIVGAIISQAALIDPFAWMPPVGEIWADCQSDPSRDDECDLAARFPGFWGHVALNLLYGAGAAGALPGLATTVRELRAARLRRPRLPLRGSPPTRLASRSSAS